MRGAHFHLPNLGSGFGDDLGSAQRNAGAYLSMMSSGPAARQQQPFWDTPLPAVPHARDNKAAAGAGLWTADAGFGGWGHQYQHAIRSPQSRASPLIGARMAPAGPDPFSMGQPAAAGQLDDDEEGHAAALRAVGLVLSASPGPASMARIRMDPQPSQQASTAADELAPGIFTMPAVQPLDDADILGSLPQVCLTLLALDVHDLLPAACPQHCAYTLDLLPGFLGTLKER